MPTCKANYCYTSIRYSCDNYCSYHEKCLNKVKTKKNISNIREIETFGTPFNGNCEHFVWEIVFGKEHSKQFHSILFLAWNFLVTPLFLFAPLVVLLFSLASLNSVWYTILKWFGRLSFIFMSLLGLLVFQALYHGGEVGEKILERGRDFFLNG